jgi:hypothetical protein
MTVFAARGQLVAAPASDAVTAGMVVFSAGIGIAATVDEETCPSRQG